MKTLELLAVLSPQEVEDFSEKLKNQKRSSLYRLFCKFQNESNVLQKDKLYFSAFEEKYTPDKDYLLRNEFRLLNKEIEKFIILNEVCDVFANTSHKLSGHILDRLLRTGQYKLFEKTWNSAIRNSLRDYDFENLYQLNLRWVDYLRNHKEISTKNLNELLKALNSGTVYLEGVFEMRRTKISFHEAYSKRIAKVIDAGTLKDSNDSMPMKHKQFLEQYQNYYSCMSKAYATTGDDKLEILKACIPSLDLLISCDEVFRKEKVRVLGNIAVEYFIKRQFEEADYWYLEALQFMDKQKVMIDLVFNFAVNLISLGRYQEMVDTYYQYLSEIKETPKVRYRFEYFTCLALALMNKPEDAYKILNHEIQKRPEKDYFYFRLIYAVLAFEQGGYIDCLRELENIKQSPRYKNHLDLDELRMMKWIRRLARNFEKPMNKEERKANLRAIAEAYFREVSENPIQTIILERWFLEKLKEGGANQITIT